MQLVEIEQHHPQADGRGAGTVAAHRVFQGGLGDAFLAVGVEHGGLLHHGFQGIAFVIQLDAAGFQVAEGEAGEVQGHGIHGRGGLGGSFEGRGGGRGRSPGGLGRGGRGRRRYLDHAGFGNLVVFATLLEQRENHGLLSVGSKTPQQYITTSL
ncbi:MAG: hypothetical protein FDZ72_15580 [Betaproteobacteria bacterium]|nr:MAG: hypothetical protein FDZ72_15580 [Betaproteobacteria bacterium]